MTVLLSLLFSLLWLAQGCHRSLTADEVFKSSILDPEPVSVTHLQGRYIARHERTAWLHFSASTKDCARILTALNAQEIGWSEFDHVTGDFDEALEALRPPKDWFRKCRLYEGISSKAGTSSIAVKRDTGEVFVNLQQI